MIPVAIQARPRREMPAVGGRLLTISAGGEAYAASSIARGSATYRQVRYAFFLAGFATFSLLYCVQPLLPALAEHFAVDAASVSLALSLSTGFLAVAIAAAAVVSERFGRRSLMFASMVAAATLNIAVAFAPGWHALLALEGFLLGGVPAVAMAYLAEEISPEGLGAAMGLYVAGTAFGGMIGRVGTGILAELFSWQVAMAGIGLAGLAAAAGFIALVPPSRNFVRSGGFDQRYHWRAWSGHLRHPALPLIFAIGFLVMGAFVSIYNYAGFRLTAAPYNLSQTELGLIFMVYIFGIATSSIAGGLADRIGRARVLTAGLVVMAIGIALTMPQSLIAIIAGIVALTVGFFITHSVASGWVGRLAVSAKGHASSLYLLAYYMGSSIAGSVAGWFWTNDGWPGVVAFTFALVGLGLVAALRLGSLAQSA